MGNKIYKIGDLAKEFSVTLRTLRFYEDRGLINPARSGTTRLYSNEDRERLSIALFCKRIGLSLGEIREVLDLHDMGEGADAPAKMHEIFASQLQELERQKHETNTAITDLQIRIAEMGQSVKH